MDRFVYKSWQFTLKTRTGERGSSAIFKSLELDESNGICLHNIASTLQSMGALQESLDFYNHL